MPLKKQIGCFNHSVVRQAEETTVVMVILALLIHRTSRKAAIAQSILKM